MAAAREAEMAERTRPGQLRRMQGRDFLKAGGVEKLWPEGVRVGEALEAQSSQSWRK